MPETITYFSLADVERMFARTSRVWLAAEAVFKSGAPWVRVRFNAPTPNDPAQPSESSFALEVPWEQTPVDAG